MSKPSPVEPRFARIAASIGDPTRARMLSALLGGEQMPAGQLAQLAGVSPSTASEHLAKLVHEGLVAVEVRGRHRYFRVAGADVARALEALALVAERGTLDTKWLREPYRALKQARTCYKHIAGELGVRLLDSLVRHRRLVPAEHGYDLTPSGRSWLSQAGVQVDDKAREARYAYGCLDWSERREHLAGRLATAILERFLAERWVLRERGSRVLTLTPRGKGAIADLL